MTIAISWGRNENQNPYSLIRTGAMERAWVRHRNHCFAEQALSIGSGRLAGLLRTQLYRCHQRSFPRLSVQRRNYRAGCSGGCGCQQWRPLAHQRRPPARPTTVEHGKRQPGGGLDRKERCRSDAAGGRSERQDRSHFYGGLAAELSLYRIFGMEVHYQHYVPVNRNVVGGSAGACQSV